MQGQRSLLLITADCLRADHVGFLGYRGGATPFLDSLADRSWVFKNAIVAGTPTYYSFPAMMASRYPLALGRDVIGLAPAEQTLASVLKDAGYATACFSAANPYISRRYGYDQGFDTFRDFLDSEPNAAHRTDTETKSSGHMRYAINQRLDRLFATLGMESVYDELYFQYLQRLAAPPLKSLDILRPYPSADLIVDQARAWLASNGRSAFFLWLHLMDAHSPYYPVQKGLELMKERKLTPARARYLNAYWNRGHLSCKKLARHRDEVIRLYDTGVRWIDTQIERLIAVLRQFGAWDNCVFAFTADHGEEFLDHGGRYHAPLKLTEEIVHVPLLMRIPDDQARSVPSPFSLLHLAPTLLDVLGIPAPKEFQGKSFTPEIASGEGWEDPALAECVKGCTNPLYAANRMGPRLLAVHGRKYKLVIDFQKREEQLFNLEADPKEHAPLIPEADIPIRRQLLDFAQVHLENSRLPQNARGRLGALLEDLKRGLRNRKPVVSGSA